MIDWKTNVDIYHRGDGSNISEAATRGLAYFLQKLVDMNQKGIGKLADLTHRRKIDKAFSTDIQPITCFTGD